jgi:hypothetical protein
VVIPEKAGAIFFSVKTEQRCFLVVKMKSAQNPETESVSKLLEEAGLGKRIPD